MKEATGELSTTVITVVAIAAISTLFIVFLYPQLRSSILLNQACSEGPEYKYIAEDKSYAVGCGSKQNDGTWYCHFQSGKDIDKVPTGETTGAKHKHCSNNN